MINKSLFLLVACIAVLIGCHSSQTNVPKTEPVELIVKDNRPKDEREFLKRVDAEYAFVNSKNETNKESHIKAFNTYAKDSLQNFKDWELIVTGVDQDPAYASTFADRMLNTHENGVYSLMLAAPIRIDRTTDTITITNRVSFVYTILKNANGDVLKKQITTIRPLTKGDTVIVSGAVTRIDLSNKVDFAELFENSIDWNFDLLLTDIHIKHH